MAAWLLVLALPAAGVELSEHELQVEPHLWLAGVLNADAPLARGTLVVDLRGADDADAIREEQRRLLAQGIMHVNLPTSGAPPPPEDVEWLAEVLDAFAGSDVVLHCRSGNRAALMWAAVAERSGAPPDAIRARVAPLVTSETVSASLDAVLTGQQIGQDVGQEAGQEAGQEVVQDD